MLQKKYILIAATFISLALLIPGISQPLISLKAEINRQTLITEGKKLISEQKISPALAAIANKFLDDIKVKGRSTLYDRSRSISGTAQDLWTSGYLLVAVLIVLFSIVIPVFKASLLLIAAITNNNGYLLWLNGLLSKWSMADVFAIGVTIACLAANGSSRGSSPPSSALLYFHAELNEGFYWFLAYCLVSIATGQLMEKCCREKASGE